MLRAGTRKAESAFGHMQDARENLQKYLDSVKDLSEEDKTQIAAYPFECDRGLKREQSRYRGEQRRRRR